MTYTMAAVTGVVAAVLIDVFAIRSRVVLGKVFWCTYPIIFGFQLLSNGILTGRGVVLYNPADILGLRLVYAPVEDLLFGFALIVLTLSLWVRLSAASRPGPDPSGPPAPPP
ncbi:lycopene cyclase domain-containing protein [Dactylosporangium sp. NPDC049742]|uniref:lycopene cyclase domain-containing protein n=1 Tax=Dactylosporangium sp. NPDC049742 TaxID=3154737 RepID=UPI003434E8DF